MSKTIHYAVYDHPKDFPNDFVVRRWFIDLHSGKTTPEEELFMKSKDIDEIRGRLREMQLYRINRCKDDDPIILETWFYL